MKYSIRVGAKLPAAAAQGIGEELERLADQSDALSAADVVEAASRKRSPLHPYFEWDDVRAAQLYREDQARYLLRSITVVVEKSDEPKEVRAFYSVKTDEAEEEQPERRYVSISTVRSEPLLAEQVIESAHQELVGWKERYEQYREIFPAFEQRFRPVLELIDRGRSMQHS